MAQEHTIKNTGLRGVTVADTRISFIDGEKGVLLYGGYSSTEYALEYGQKNYSAWGPPKAPIKIIMTVGIFLMLLQTIAIFFRDIATARGKSIS